MTLGSGLLLGLAPDPLPALSNASLTGLNSQLAPTSAPVEQEAATPPVKSIWERIVIHDTGTEAGDLRTLDRQHQSLGGCAYHFVITADGKVEASTRWRDQKLAPAAADGQQAGPNVVAGIQIVLVGNFEQHKPSPAQVAALNDLIADLVKTQGLPASATFLHRDLDTAAPRCPGAKFSR
ncbi:MAG: peptidoglycan recognition family protein [Phycisphaerae bacterium]|nr:peptidoglycan recognition family protein [Phycisphaerae bacterium]